MRRLLGVLTLVLLLPLSACGEEGDDDAGGADPTSPTATTSPTGTGSPEGEVIEILSQTAAGGEPGASAVRLDRPGGVARLTRGLRGNQLTVDLERTVNGIRLREGQSLWGQVIAVGCDVPPSATVHVVDGDVSISPGKVPAPKPECFAPVTSVAVAVVTGDPAAE